MRHHTLFIVCSILATSSAVAEIEYDYELSLSFGAANTDFSGATVSVGGVPMPSLGSFSSSTDTDTINLLGTWYFQGLSDVDGPRSEAAFLNRASSLSFGYSYGDGSSVSQTSGTQFPSSLYISDTRSESFSLAMRYVVPGSGWYALAGVSRLEIDDNRLWNGVSFSRKSDANSYNVGLGKYIGENTAVDLTIARTEVDGFDSTGFGLSFKHIGSLGSSWQYGLDAGLSTPDTDFDDGSISLGFSLFPNRNLEFGIGLDLQEIASGPDRTSYGAFASWFIRDNIELNGRLMFDDMDDFAGSDSDGDAAQLGVTVRF